ncbi:MAG: phosphoesterase PA-phosphatase related [Gemmatimonadetes bacterium]|nr:phosphoesterase PA-phosphatase related [Gemmatimonadota bacterium]
MTDVAPHGEGRGNHSAGALAVLIATSTLLAFVAEKVRRGETKAFDQSAREAMQRQRTAALDATARPITVLSLPVVVVGATATLVWWLQRNERTNAARTVAGVPIVAAIVGQGFTMFFPQQTPPDATSSGAAHEASFPSGHTTGVTAEALSIAFVLQRERLASPAVIAALLAWPVVVGVSRIYRDRHWTSDILAGWMAGTAVAAGAALFHERGAYG